MYIMHSNKRVCFSCGLLLLVLVFPIPSILAFQQASSITRSTTTTTKSTSVHRHHGYRLLKKQQHLDLPSQLAVNYPRSNSNANNIPTINHHHNNNNSTFWTTKSSSLVSVVQSLAVVLPSSLLRPQPLSSLLLPAAYVFGTILGGNVGTPFVLAAKKSWYDRIAKPKWTPPNRIFAPVWITLYTLVGLAVYRITSLNPSTTPLQLLRRLSLVMYGVHYLLNIIWAPIFFGWKRLRLGHVLNILLLTTLAPVLYGFYRIDQLSAFLLIPYMLWLFVATALSNGICKLNPTIKGYNNAMLEADIYSYQQKAAKYAGL
jgi:benzodiazapine receptor